MNISRIAVLGVLGCSVVYPATAKTNTTTTSTRQNVRIIASSNETLAAPQLIRYNHPFYTDEAQTRGIEGTVTIRAAIGINGVPHDLQIVRGLDLGLDENAMLAIREWRFTPAQRDAAPVETTAEIDVEFQLGNSPSSELLGNVVSVRSGASEPQLVRRVEPQYSLDAAAKKLDGSVVLAAVILEDGSVRVIRLVSGLGSGLDESAIKAIEQWKFTPAMKDGKPVRIRTDVAVRFSHEK